MKNNKGITMVTLVIIIVVLLILSGVSIGIGSISVTSYKDSVLNSEAKEVQMAVISQYQKYLAVKDTGLFFGTKCDENGNVLSIWWNEGTCHLMGYDYDKEYFQTLPPFTHLHDKIQQLR